jgi:hypothetical protein
MTRMITSEDDVSGVRARLVVQDNAITHLSLDADPAGLPDELIDALLPFIGLPAMTIRRNGAVADKLTDALLPPAQTGRAAPQMPAALKAAVSEVNAVAAALKASAAPVVDFVAADDVVRDAPHRVESAEPLPVPEPAPEPEPRPVTPPAPVKKRKPGPNAKYPHPGDDALEKAVKKYGSSPTRLATHFGVPNYTAGAWLHTRRQRKALEKVRG